MKPFKLARLSITRKTFSSIIIVLAIALSVASCGMLLRIYRLSESRLSTIGTGYDAIVGAKAGGIEIILNALNGEGKFPDFLPYKLFETLKSQQNVHFEDGTSSNSSSINYITPYVYFDKYKNFRIIGTDETLVANPKGTLHIERGLWANHVGEIVLGNAVAQSEQLKIGDVINQMRVVGIIGATGTMWDNFLYTNLQQAQAFFDGRADRSLKEKLFWGSNSLHYFLVNINFSQKDSLENLINKRTVGQFVLVDDQKENLKNLIGFGKWIGLFLVGLVLFLSGLSVAGMLVTRFELVSVQFAVLRALGYSKKEIGLWFIYEGLLLGLSGTIIGAMIDFALFPVIRNFFVSNLPTSLISSSIFESAPVWAMTMTAIFIAVLLPFIKLYKQDVHNSLRVI